MDNKGYLVEIDYWTRSSDGDDWVGGYGSFHFDTLGEAVFKAGNPYSNTKDLIETRVLDMNAAKYGKVIWKKCWIRNEVESIIEE